MPPTILLADEHATQALGATLGGIWRAIVDSQATPGVIHLHGELGAGKTTLVRGLLHALGVQGRVRSPTYNLVDSYELPGLTCVHVDLYRLQSNLEVEELALPEMLLPGTLMLIEWPDKGGSLIPPADLELWLSYSADARELRTAAVSELGKHWASLLGWH